jgi:SAM-dependent methyltransferase
VHPKSFSDLMRLAHGFESAKIFLVANDLGLFRLVGEGSTAGVLAETLQLDERALGILLNALVALGLLEADGQTFKNTHLGRTYLASEDRRESIFKHIHRCWESWNNLADVLCHGQPDEVREEQFLHNTQDWNREFIRGMEDVTRDLAPQVVSKLKLTSPRHLLDLGGGPGVYAKAFLQCYPELEKVTIFDLPMAIDIAKERLDGYQRIGNVRFSEGDFRYDHIGSGYDIIWISQIFHSQDERGCQKLIDKAWNALLPGGTVYIHDFLLDDTKMAPVSAAIFAVHMLVMTERGRTYTGSEIGTWLEERGFIDVFQDVVSEETAIVAAVKPS